MSVVQQLSQQNAPLTSSTGVAQTGIMALMMIMMFTMDGRYQSLFGMAGKFLVILRRALPEYCATVFCAMLTLCVCWFEPEEQADSVHSSLHVRQFWPILQDPDTLLAVHGMLRCIILVSVWFRARQSWPVPASFLHFTAVSLVAQIYLNTQAAFALEGPFAGDSMIYIHGFALLMTLALARKHKLQTGERVYPLAMLSVLLVSGYVAWSNRLDIATESVENAVFSFVSFVDVAAMLHFAIYCCCSIFGGEFSSSNADGLMLVMIVDRVAVMYYVLDAFSLLPNSTSAAIGAEVKEADLTAVGHPMLLLSVAQVACVALATLGSVAYFLARFWNEDKVPVALQTPDQVRARIAEHAQVPVGKLSSIVF